MVTYSPQVGFMLFDANPLSLTIGVAAGDLYLLVPCKITLAGCLRNACSSLGERERKGNLMKMKKTRKKSVKSQKIFTQSVSRILNRRESELGRGRGLEIRDIVELKKRVGRKALAM
jgi:hypothetical protein